MIKVTTDDIHLIIDDSQLTTLKAKEGEAARQVLATIWGADIADLSHYQAIFYEKTLEELTDKDSFVSLSFSTHGYVIDTQEVLDVSEAQKQIEIDLEIINRESQWSEKDSIYFDKWWPTPSMNQVNKVLEFGVSLKDYHQKVFNRTLNRLFLTRYGHLLLNYSLSEEAIKAAYPLSYYQDKLDDIQRALVISEGYRYEDVDVDNDIPSRSRLINLILSSEIF